MMNNTILSKEQKEALDKVIMYSMPEERESLEEYITDEMEVSVDLDNMSDDELYALAKENNIDHIWLEFYHLSKAD